MRTIAPARGRRGGHGNLLKAKLHQEETEAIDLAEPIWSGRFPWVEGDGHFGDARGQREPCGSGFQNDRVAT